jgi:hypothetical protein
MRFNSSKLRQLSLAGALALIAQACLPLLVQPAFASAPNHVMVRLDRIASSTTTGGSICVMPNSGSTISNVLVTFPTTPSTDFTVNGTAANWTVSTTPTSHWPSGATALTGVTTASNVTSKTVTFPSNQTTPSSSTWYCFNFSGTTTLTTGGTSKPSTLSDYGKIHTNTDTTDVYYDLQIVGNDQIAVNATTVPPIFTMTFAGNTDGFPSNTLGTLNTLTDSTGNNINVSTNAANGWILWARSSAPAGAAKQALHSTTANYNLKSSSAVNSAAHSYAGTGEDYGTAVTVGACTVGSGTPDAAYDGASSKLGVLDMTTGSYYRIASGATASDTCPVNVKFRAAISTTTPAAQDYTDTVTVVGAGLF